MRLCSITALTVLLGGIVHAHGETIVGKIVAVSDGDTITLLAERREIKIRVAGIDAPEKKQSFGQRAKAALSDCAYGKAASVDWKKIDRYGRTIGKVLVEGTDCGLRQIELGMAWHYKAYQKEQSTDDRIAYAKAEIEAKEARRGLWVEDSPVAPWDFRQAGR